MDKTKFPALMLLVLTIALSSCASFYRPITPGSNGFTSTQEADDYSISYSYGGLARNQNKKYARREYSKEVYIVEVSITNHTEEAITIGRNVIFTDGQNVMPLISPIISSKELRQRSLSYLPYLLLGIFTLETRTNSYPAGLVAGVSLSLGNMGVAAKANRDFQENLSQYSLLGKTIPPGSTVEGIIAVPRIAPLMLESK